MGVKRYQPSCGYVNWTTRRRRRSSSFGGNGKESEGVRALKVAFARDFHLPFWNATWMLRDGAGHCGVEHRDLLF